MNSTMDESSPVILPPDLPGLNICDEDPNVSNDTFPPFPSVNSGMGILLRSLFGKHVMGSENYSGKVSISINLNYFIITYS